ncbi:MAG: VWA domain-containing protein [Deltaproteobacteria bacterium]|nr:MAG: VWA domain-containing protein [Deltaproteobacteria bacterium]
MPSIFSMNLVLAIQEATMKRIQHRPIVSGLFLSLSLAAGMAGCSAAGDAAAEGGLTGGDGGAGVGQGGAQDFGQFKKILEEGGIPGPDTIDDVGFFNEHKIELPPPDCGQDVCIHGELGVMGNMISGSNCTLVMMGMNTPIDPATLERPPMNLVVTIDTSGSMQGENIAYVREGLARTLDDLRPEDLVSVVTFSHAAEVLLEAVPGDDPQLAETFASLSATGSTNLYDGLRTSYDLVTAYDDGERQNRVIFLSDGVATAGITDADKILDLGGGFRESRITLSTIGMGTEFDPEVMRGLAEAAYGAFYFLEDPQAVVEVFEEEIQTFLYPLAYDVTIDADIADGYVLRGVYGTKSFEFDASSAAIEIPLLQIAHRETVDDMEQGRRGGGGAMLLELLPKSGTEVPPGSVGEIHLSYLDAKTNTMLDQTVKILSPLAPGETPEEGLFTDGSVEKSFVMLNIFMGFRMAAQQALIGDDVGAASLLRGLRDNVAGWLAESPDADIEDDLRYIDMFIANLEARGAGSPEDVPPPEPWPQD